MNNKVFSEYTPCVQLCNLPVAIPPLLPRKCFQNIYFSFPWSFIPHISSGVYDHAFLLSSNCVATSNCDPSMTGWRLLSSTSATLPSQDSSYPPEEVRNCSVAKAAPGLSTLESESQRNRVWVTARVLIMKSSQDWCASVGRHRLLQPSSWWWLSFSALVICRLFPWSAQFSLWNLRGINWLILPMPENSTSSAKCFPILTIFPSSFFFLQAAMTLMRSHVCISSLALASCSCWKKHLEFWVGEPAFFHDTLHKPWFSLWLSPHPFLFSPTPSLSVELVGAVSLPPSSLQSSHQGFAYARIRFSRTCPAYKTSIAWLDF